MKYKNGLIIGKFMPPHKGHEFLFRFGKHNCQELTIVIDCLKNQTISPEIRKKWIDEMGMQVNVVALKEFMPQHPNETKDFWSIWTNTLKNIVPNVDVLIASEDYGYELSKNLNCHFILLDVSRNIIPISATQIRENPLKNWNYIVESARGYFMKKICLIGPESTGKSTLGKKIAQQLNTIYIPEYAESLIKKQNGNFYEKNIEEVALTQIQIEKSLERMVHKYMICDSDIITTMVWAETLFHSVPKLLSEIAKKQKYDITFLFYPDTPWVDDIHRKVTSSNEQEFRMNMFHKMEQKLKEYQRPYEIITGSYQQKEDKIIQKIEQIFENKNTISLKIK